jgi:hypothetical protein
LRRCWYRFPRPHPRVRGGPRNSPRSPARPRVRAPPGAAFGPIERTWSSEMSSGACGRHAKRSTAGANRQARARPRSWSGGASHEQGKTVLGAGGARLRPPAAWVSGRARLPVTRLVCRSKWGLIALAARRRGPRRPAIAPMHHACPPRGRGGARWGCGAPWSASTCPFGGRRAGARATRAGPAARAPACAGRPRRRKQGTKCVTAGRGRDPGGATRALGRLLRAPDGVRWRPAAAVAPPCSPSLPWGWGLGGARGQRKCLGVANNLPGQAPGRQASRQAGGNAGRVVAQGQGLKGRPQPGGMQG